MKTVLGRRGLYPQMAPASGRARVYTPDLCRATVGLGIHALPPPPPPGTLLSTGMPGHFAKDNSVTSESQLPRDALPA